MTPDDETRRLAFAFEKLEIAVAALTGGDVSPATCPECDRELAQTAVQHAMAAIQEVQRARLDPLATADVWTVLDLIVTEFASHEGSYAYFDSRLVARAIVLNREHKREPELPERRPDTLA